jgi:hypothetical protein
MFFNPKRVLPRVHKALSAFCEDANKPHQDKATQRERGGFFLFSQE